MQTLRDCKYRNNKENIERQGMTAEVINLGGHLVIVRGIDLEDLYLRVEEERKVPLWKQSMQLQMGQMPQSKITDYRSYRLDIVKAHSSEYFPMYDSDARCRLEEKEINDTEINL